MSQNDYIIANQTAPNFRSDLNDALQALASLSSGATAPSTTYANMLWYDTANDLLKMRTEADDAWITIGTLNQSTNTFEVANLTELSQAQVEDDTDTTFGLVSGQRLGQAVAANVSSSGLVPLATATASSDATIEFTAFDSTKYDSYVFVLSGVRGASDSDLKIRLSIDGGASFASSSSYGWEIMGQENGVAVHNNDQVDTEIHLTASQVDTGDTIVGVSGRVELFDVAGGSDGTCAVLSQLGYSKDGTGYDPQLDVGYGFFANSDPETNGIQFFFHSGNIADGTITMYGRLKA